MSKTVHKSGFFKEHYLVFQLAKKLFFEFIVDQNENAAEIIGLNNLNKLIEFINV